MGTQDGESRSSERARLKTVTLFLCLVWLFLAVIFRPWENFLSPNQRFENLWLGDFKKLQDSHSLPKEFSQIKSVRYESLSPELQKYLEKNHGPNFNINENGHYNLEIILDKLENGGVMMQYDLIDARGNTVWELGRTFSQPIFK